MNWKDEKRRGLDQSSRPIIAMDFDGTITIGTGRTYPIPQNDELRKYTKEVINFMREVGIIVVIWTSRDRGGNGESTQYSDDITPAVQFLKCNGIGYDGVNYSFKWAPFKYRAQKIFAHMYVDDRAFGWYDDDDILLEVLRSFLVKVCGVDEELASQAVADITIFKEVNKDVKRKISEHIHRWGM